MTDLQRTKNFLDSLGILYTVSSNRLYFGNSVYGEQWEGFPKCDKVSGYNGFYTCFEFDDLGKFKVVGAWE